MVTWTIEVDALGRRWKELNLNRQLNNDAPTSFDAQVEYDAENPVEFFDSVNIKKNGSSEWRGFIEHIEVIWAEDGRYYNISGRDVTVILWKKQTDNFVNMQENTQGFFGSVNPHELLKFLLRTPQSDDDYNAYPKNKEGWGMDRSRMTQLSAGRTAYGDPDWTILRKRGIGWRNSGSPFNHTDLEVNAVVSNTWGTAGSSPYLTDEDDDDYISSMTLDATGIFRFEALESSATSIENVSINVVWRPDKTWNPFVHAEFEMWVSWDNGSSWVHKATILGRTPFWADNPWITFSYDATNEFYFVDTLQGSNPLVKFINKSDNLTSFITQCYLSVSYAKDGTQGIQDWFAINFSKSADIMGIYVESRMDNDSYPRNYEIVTNTGVKEDFSTFAETDPNGRIVVDNTPPDPHVHWSNYSNESAYLSKDYGAGAITDFDFTIGFMLDAGEPNLHMLCPMCISAYNEDIKTMDDANHHNVRIEIYRDSIEDAVWAKFTVRDSVGATQYTTAITGFAEDTIYYGRIVRSGTEIHFYIYSDEEMGTPIVSWDWTIYATETFRYRMAVVTHNDDTWGTDLFRDHMENSFSGFTENGGTGTYSWDTGEKEEGSYSLKVTISGAQYYYCRKDTIARDEIQERLHVRVPNPSWEDTLDAYHASTWVAVNSDWDKIGSSPYLEDDDETNYINMTNESGRLGEYDQYYAFDAMPAKFRHIDSTISLGYCNFHLKGKLFQTESKGPTTMEVKIELYNIKTGSFVDCGNLIYNSYSWDNKSIDLEPIFHGDAEILQNTALRVTFYAHSNEAGNENYGGLSLTYCYISINAVGYWGNVNVGKIIDKNIYATGDPDETQVIAGVACRVCPTSNYYRWVLWGWNSDSDRWEVEDDEDLAPVTWYELKLECGTGTTDGFARLRYGDDSLIQEATAINNSNCGDPTTAIYEIYGESAYESSFWYLDYVSFKVNPSINVGIIYSTTEGESVIVPEVTNNTYRDIIHSFPRQNIDNLKIKITAPDTHGWAISQVYIYLSETAKYKVWKETGDTDTFDASQYITDVVVDDAFTTPIGPMNLPRGRLLDTLNKLITVFNDSYISYKWWLDSDNEVHTAKRRGSDKSSTIVFRTGIEEESAEEAEEIDETVQRVKIIGRGEGIREELVSSGWKESTAEMTNIHTFFEEVISDKTVANKTHADLLANIYLAENAAAKDGITVSISNDIYDAMAYDVGDDIKLEDSLIPINASKRIYNLKKNITAEGEKITIYLGKPFKTADDEFGEIYRRLKAVELVGTLAADWSGEGFSEAKVDANKLSTLFEKTAKNDDVDIGNDKTDPKWVSTGAATNGKNWFLNDNKMALYGPDTGTGVDTIEVELRNDYIETSDPDAYPMESTGIYSIKVSESPKLEFEFKAYEITEGSPKYWNEGDYLDVGMRDGVLDYGYWFRITRLSGDTYQVDAVWREPSGTEDSKLIQIINRNQKYRFVITVDYENRMVVYDVYNVLYNASFPISAVKIGIDEGTQIRPINLKFTCNHENTITYRAMAFLYRINIQIERVMQ